MKNSFEKKQKIKIGVPSNRILIPAIIVLALLHFVIILVMLNISKANSTVSELLQKNNLYSQESSGFVGGSALLSETTLHYVLTPEVDGKINYSPLLGAAGELKLNRRSADVIERFKQLGADGEALQYLIEAGRHADAMLEANLHAIALVNRFYRITDDPRLTILVERLPSLNSMELELDKEESLGLAASLILSDEYAQHKANVSANAGRCVSMLAEASEKQAESLERDLSILRVVLWVSVLLIVLTIFFTVVVFYFGIMKPLRISVQRIAEDKALNGYIGLREYRVLAKSYNSLMSKRVESDKILKLAAETDSLTGLPNRHFFRLYVDEVEKAGKQVGNVAVILFDVNYLKHTNDAFGHAAGDELLKNAAKCIYDCFGHSEDKNCFRIGGDEFAAVIKNYNEEEYQPVFERFVNEQALQRISIAWGCASSDVIEPGTLDDLLNQADKKMYTVKKKQHSGIGDLFGKKEI